MKSQEVTGGEIHEEVIWSHRELLYGVAVGPGGAVTP